MGTKVIKHVIEMSMDLDVDDYDEGATEQDIIEAEKQAILEGDTVLDELFDYMDNVTVTIEEVDS